MFSGYQEREDYEDEVYRDETDSGLSDGDSELEFQLYSQLHYSAKNQETHEDSREVQPSITQTESQQSLPPPPSDVIVIDSGPDVILLSDNTEEDDSVCALKGQSSKHCGALQKKGSPNRIHSARPPQVPTGASFSENVVVLDSDSDESSDSHSAAPFVEDPYSDSDSDSDRLENWMILGRGKQDGDQSIQLNLSIPDHSETEEYVKRGGNVQNWAVSEKDKQAQISNKGVGPRRLSNRYYTEKSVTCHNCKKTGHLSKNCPSPKKVLCCSLCGIQGHLARSCPNRHCSNCFLPGHTYDECLERPYWYKRCHRCGMTGHFNDACPEIWRQYHITTSPGPFCKASDPEACRTPAYCYNCSKKGHFGHECSEKRMFNGTYPTLPFISYYDTTRDINCRDHRLKKKAKEMQDAGLISTGVVSSTPQPPRKKQKTSHSQTSTHTDNTHTPKRRIAHTPKHQHQAHKKNTHIHFEKDPQTSSNNTKRTAHSAFTPQEQGKKKAKKKKKNAVIIIDEDADFPRGGRNGPLSTNIRPETKGGKNNTKKKIQTKKKERIARKRQKKAERDSAKYPSDENLFQIKQRKKSR